MNTWFALITIFFFVVIQSTFVYGLSCGALFSRTQAIKEKVHPRTQDGKFDYAIDGYSKSYFARGIDRVSDAEMASLELGEGQSELGSGRSGFREVFETKFWGFNTGGGGKVTCSDLGIIRFYRPGANVPSRILPKTSLDPKRKLLERWLIGVAGSHAISYEVGLLEGKTGVSGITIRVLNDWSLKAAFPVSLDSGLTSMDYHSSTGKLALSFLNGFKILDLKNDSSSPIGSRTMGEIRSLVGDEVKFSIVSFNQAGTQVALVVEPLKMAENPMLFVVHTESERITHRFELDNMLQNMLPAGDLKWATPFEIEFSIDSKSVRVVGYNVDARDLYFNPQQRSSYRGEPWNFQQHQAPRTPSGAETLYFWEASLGSDAEVTRIGQ